MNFRILTVALMLCVAALPAHAGLRKCNSHQLTSADNRAVRKVITETAGGREVLWPSMAACVNRGGALTWVDLKEEPQLDGSLIKFFMDCGRERDAWTCELGKSRSSRIEVEFVGRQTTFDLDLPPELDLQLASKLLIRASDVAPILKVEQQCGYAPQSVRTERDENLFRIVQDNFLLLQSIVAGRIDNEESLVSLVVNDAVLRFSWNFEGDTEPEFRCWTFEIIVS